MTQNTLCVQRVSELAQTAPVSPCVFAAGYAEPADGGGGMFWFDAKSSEKVDSGYVFPSPVATRAGRWIRVPTGSVRIEQFGGGLPTSTHEDDDRALHVGLDYATDRSLPLELGGKNVRFSNPLVMKHGSFIRGGKLTFVDGGAGGAAIRTVGATAATIRVEDVTLHRIPRGTGADGTTAEPIGFLLRRANHSRLDRVSVGGFSGVSSATDAAWGVGVSFELTVGARYDSGHLSGNHTHVRFSQGIAAFSTSCELRQLMFGQLAGAPNPDGLRGGVVIMSNGTATGHGSSLARIQSCIFEGLGDTSIHVRAGHATVIDGCRFEGLDAPSAIIVDPLNEGQGQNTTIINNIFSDSNQAVALGPLSRYTRIAYNKHSAPAKVVLLGDPVKVLKNVITAGTTDIRINGNTHWSDSSLKEAPQPLFVDPSQP